MVVQHVTFRAKFISSQLARFVSNPARVHFYAAIRVLIYLKHTKEKVFELRPNLQQPFLCIFVDSNWGTGFSISGAAFTFMGVLFHWFSKTQRSVSMSSTEAEYFSACMAARDGIFFRELLADFGYVQACPTPIRSDNKGVSDLSWDPEAFKTTKHILRAAKYLRDVVTRRVALVRWIPGGDNIADLFTKAPSIVVFRRLMLLCADMSVIPV